MGPELEAIVFPKTIVMLGNSDKNVSEEKDSGGLIGQSLPILESNNNNNNNNNNTQSEHSQNALIRDQDGLSEDDGPSHFKYFAAKGHYLRPFEEADRIRAGRRDKDPLTDEEQERIILYVSNAESKREKDVVKVDETAHARFSRYKHHHFIGEWFILNKESDQDEEWWIEDPPVLLEDDSQYLCELCRHIDFGTLFTKRGLPGNNLPGMAKIDLHGVDWIVRQEHCAFCKLITRKLVADSILDLKDVDTLKFCDFSLKVIDEGEEQAIRLEFEVEDCRRRCPPQIYVIQRLNTTNDTRMFDGLGVDGTRINIALLQKWTGTSTDDAPGADRAADQLSKLRLINVNENRICEVDLPCQYTCLSYVWGGSNQITNTTLVRSIIEQPDGLVHESIHLSKTITDAIEVTRQLSIPYLWVDALCIEQDSDTDKQSIIANMSSIYSKAALNLVASTNMTPADGLPGVTNIPRSREQMRATFQGLEVAIAFCDIRGPISLIESSKWNTRGWNYQERQLSQRAVHFTESQMIFVLQDRTFFEDTVHNESYRSKSRPFAISDSSSDIRTQIQHAVWFDPNSHHHANKGFQTEDGIMYMMSEEFDENAPHQWFDDSKTRAPVYEHAEVPEEVSGMLQLRDQNFWNLYRKAVASYSARDLTDPSDIIPAFNGLCNYIRQGANFEFWFNIPSCAIDQALLWYPRAPLTRRQYDDQDLHPSWSWAGWEGPVYYKGRGWYNSLYHGPVSAVKWARQHAPREAVEQNYEWLCKIPDGADIISRILSGAMTFAGTVNPLILYHLEDWKELGWECVFNDARNQHEYTHPTYPGSLYHYPINLPGQETITLPGKKGQLHFYAYSATIRIVDDPISSPTRKAYTDPFLQLGTNDEHRSANHRPSSHRIIYHQGYRAGYLVLNIPFSDLDPTHQNRYQLLAMSRDELPQIHSSDTNMEFHRKYHPVDYTYAISWRQYCDRADKDNFKSEIIQPPLREDMDPTPGPWSENGSPNWDQTRFPTQVLYPVYNVLLVERVGLNETKDSSVRRIGVGKMHFMAFHHAKPDMGVVQLV